MEDFSRIGLIKVNDFWVRAQLEQKQWCIYVIPKGKESEWAMHANVPIVRLPSSHILSAREAVKHWEQKRK